LACAVLKRRLLHRHPEQATCHHSRNQCRVPHIPDFLWCFVGSLNFMRLSLMKGAHAILSRAAYRKFGASRSFLARCGIPQASPSSLLRTLQIRPGAPCSHQRTWAENDGRSPTTACRAGSKLGVRAAFAAIVRCMLNQGGAVLSSRCDPRL
jgi:hypothetical protein